MQGGRSGLHIDRDSGRKHSHRENTAALPGADRPPRRRWLLPEQRARHRASGRGALLEGPAEERRRAQDGDEENDWKDGLRQARRKGRGHTALGLPRKQAPEGQLPRGPQSMSPPDRRAGTCYEGMGCTPSPGADLLVLFDPRRGRKRATGGIT